MIKLKIDDEDYIIELPEGYSSPSRLVWKNGYPGVNATNNQGKTRWFRASKIKNMTKEGRKKYA